jgi:hypothetical protein
MTHFTTEVQRLLNVCHSDEHQSFQCLASQRDLFMTGSHNGGVEFAYDLHIMNNASIQQYCILGGVRYALYMLNIEAHGSVVVKALCYKPEGRGFDIR